jgi:hypothetical protein
LQPYYLKKRFRIINSPLERGVKETIKKDENEKDFVEWNALLLDGNFVSGATRERRFCDRL